jgi:branched-chain amino acid transport system permease protein
VLVGGLLAGVMYSLVAIGFVLIYKASGVFNLRRAPGAVRPSYVSSTRLERMALLPPRSSRWS